MDSQTATLFLSDALEIASETTFLNHFINGEYLTFFNSSGPIE